jgi:DNA repair exonuclease SbcCD ATPase subunit
MSTYVPLLCPNCMRVRRVRVEYLGQRILCNGCNQPFHAHLESGATNTHGPDSEVVGEDAARLQARIRAMEHALDESNARFEAATLDHREQLEAARSQWAEERAELLAESEHERETLWEAVKQHEAEKHQWFAQHKDAQEQHAALQRHLEHDRKSFRAEREALHCVVECLRNERDEARLEAGVLRHARVEAQRRFEDLEHRLAERDNRLDSLREALDRQAREFEAERQQLREQSAASEARLRAELASLRRDLDSQAQERDLAFQEAASLRLESEVVRLLCNERESEIETLRRSLAELSTRAGSARGDAERQALHPAPAPLEDAIEVTRTPTEIEARTPDLLVLPHAEHDTPRAPHRGGADSWNRGCEPAFDLAIDDGPHAPGASDPGPETSHSAPDAPAEGDRGPLAPDFGRHVTPARA